MWSVLRRHLVRASENTCYILRDTKRHAGHSKWSNIKHIKAEKDAERATLFAKFAKDMRVAITAGGSPKPTENLRLSQVIEQAKKKSMPLATINNVLEKAAKAPKKFQTSLLDLRGPGGCILIVELHTDNLKGLKMVMQSTFRKFRCTSADQSARHVFHHQGIVITEQMGTLDAATEDAIAVGAEDVEEIDKDGKKLFRFTCESGHLAKVVNQLGNLKYNILSSEEEFEPRVFATLTDDDVDRVTALFAKLETFEEVVRIHDNIA